MKRFAWTICGCMVGTSSFGAYFSGTATAIINNQNSVTDSRGGSEPPVEVLAENAHTQNSQTWCNAFGHSGPGLLWGDIEGESVGAKTTSAVELTGTYNDIVFTWIGEGEAPIDSFVSRMRYTFKFTQTATGSLGTIAGLNFREGFYSVSVTGQTSAFSDGHVLITVNGSSGTEDIGLHTTDPFSVSTQTALTVDFTTTLGCTAVPVGAPGLTRTSVVGNLLPGQVGAGFADEGVFDVPDGFTVNSVSMGIVNNHWVGAVPEPSTLAALGLGVLAAWRRRRK